MTRSLFASCLVASILAAPAISQPGAIAGLDISLYSIGTIANQARAGAYPNGVNGFCFTTTSCNPGTVTIPFQGAMNPNHPFIAFLMAKESGGRLRQISDWSYVKHAFASTNSSSSGCAPCTNPGTSSLLGIGCTDTYSSGTNGNHYYLGPPSEIDPFTGNWNPVCSHFDRGEPPVSPPSAQCDGVRSLDSAQTNALNATVGHRIRVADQELIDPGATFWYQGCYVARNEPEMNRNNNLGSMRFTPAWDGSVFTAAPAGEFMPGSILQRWSGALVTSGTNGIDDGRLYVAARVTGPVAGMYHYEYAFHNRDNARGVRSFRIPVCAGATVANAGFGDIDANGANDWSFTVDGGEIVFWTSTFAADPGANALRWNSIYNVWFDCNAAPEWGLSLALQAFAPGAGQPSFTVNSWAPVGLWNVVLGPGCGNPTPILRAIGSPPRATLGNATFGLEVIGFPSFAPVLLASGTVDGVTPLGPSCNLYMGGTPGLDIFLLSGQADIVGTFTVPIPIPADPLLENLHANVQAAGASPGGPLLGAYVLTNGLRVRIGNTPPPCP